MELPIQPDDVLTLASFHLIAGLLLYAIAWRLLPQNKRFPLAIGLGAVWLWSLAAMLDFMWGNTGFNSWFLNPSAEKNLSAMLSSSMLLLIGLSAVLLFWRSDGHQKLWQRGYWLLLAILFVFLAADEYFSIHESISFWRQGYLALGGLAALLGLAVLVSSENQVRWPLLMFLVGLGTMGVFGVVLDAFSAHNVISIGSFNPQFMYCRDEFLGVMCRDYNNSEETAEMFGMVVMVLSLLSLASLWASETQWKRTRNIVFGLSTAWLVGLAAWLWIIPLIQSTTAIATTVDYGDLSLIAYSVSESTIEAGDTLEVSIYMRVNQSITSDYSLSVHLYTQALPDVDSIAQDDMELGDFKYPTRAWLPYLPVRNDFRLQIPDDLATSASYRLVAILWQDTPENTIAVQETSLDTLANSTVTILDGIAAPPSDIDSIPMSAAYDFAPDFSLEGYDLPEEVTVGDTITVEFWWSTQAELDLELTQFLHWFHSETGEYVIFDQIPFTGAFPTQDWPKDLLAQDSWAIILPDDMPAGIYRVQTGLFGVESQERVPVTDADGERVLDDSVVLGVVTVNGK